MHDVFALDRLSICLALSLFWKSGSQMASYIHSLCWQLTTLYRAMCGNKHTGSACKHTPGKELHAKGSLQTQEYHDPSPPPKYGGQDRRLKPGCWGGGGSVMDCLYGQNLYCKITKDARGHHSHSIGNVEPNQQGCTEKEFLKAAARGSRDFHQPSLSVLTKGTQTAQFWGICHSAAPLPFPHAWQIPTLEVGVPGTSPIGPSLPPHPPRMVEPYSIENSQ